MHYRVILLAVCVNFIEAGPIRYHGAIEQHRNLPRFLNMTGLEPVLPSKTQTSQTSLISTSEALISSKSIPHDFTPGNPQSSTSAPSHTSALLASSVSSGRTSGIASGEAQHQKQVQNVAASDVFSAATIGSGSAGAITAISSASPTAASIVKNSDSLAQSSTAILSRTSPLPTDQQILSSSANAIAAIATKAADSSTASSSATFSGAVSTKPAANKYPTAENGNLAMANSYNQVFKTLSQTSTCNPKDNSSATVCIDGEPATCEVDGTYTLKSCPQGQSCYAIPQPAGQSGVNIGCYVPSSAAENLAAGSQSIPAAISSTPNPILADASKPTSTASLNTEAKQAIVVASSAAVLNAVTSKSAQAQITGPESTSIQLPPEQTASPVSSTSHPVNVAQLQHEGASAQPEQFSSTKSSGASSATAKLDNQSGSEPQQSMHEVAGSTRPPPLSLTTTIPAASRSSGPAGKGGLVLSFPSDLPASTATVATQQPQPSPSADALPEAPTSNQKNFRPAAESVILAGPSGEPSASASLNPGNGHVIAANNVPAATTFAPSSVTVSVNAAGITIVPQPNSSGPVTVTVTVTMTIHDRN